MGSGLALEGDIHGRFGVLAQALDAARGHQLGHNGHSKRTNQPQTGKTACQRPKSPTNLK